MKRREFIIDILALIISASARAASIFIKGPVVHAVAGGATVQYDTSAESTGSTATLTEVVTIVVANNPKRLLIVGSHAGNGGTPTVVSCVSSLDGALTAVAGGTAAGTSWSFTFTHQKVAPTVGTHVITTTYSTTVQGYVAAISLYAVDQSTPIGTVVTQGGAGTNPRAAVTLLSGGMAVGMTGTDAGNTLAADTAGTGTTGRQIINNLASDIDAGLATNTGTGSVTVGWTAGNDNRATVVIPVNAG